MTRNWLLGTGVRLLHVAGQLDSGQSSAFYGLVVKIPKDMTIDK